MKNKNIFVKSRKAIFHALLVLAENLCLHPLTNLKNTFNNKKNELGARNTKGAKGKQTNGQHECYSHYLILHNTNNKKEE